MNSEWHQFIHYLPNGFGCILAIDSSGVLRGLTIEDDDEYELELARLIAAGTPIISDEEHDLLMNFLHAVSTFSLPRQDPVAVMSQNEKIVDLLKKINYLELFEGGLEAPP